DNSDADIEAWDIARALDACGEAWNDSSYTLTGDALGYISKVYSTNDFYKTGAWDLQQYESIPSSVTSGAVVEFTGGTLLNAPRFGRLTSGFGFRPRFGRMHKGLDFAMAVGDTVRVPLSGTVTHVGAGRGYGNYVIISHGGGLETRYAHLQASLVQVGEVVVLGDAIALSGNTGNSTGPHLHFETRFYGTAVDPRQVFSFNGF
ncbi:MAG: M23 family metallopeptidase, partial [Muribaculaceae bacterium]|nr:M23 family metallopeptidase [Muribaculaceae bacterium]